MAISPRLPQAVRVHMGFGMCILAAVACGDPPADMPAGSFLSSLKQAINKDFDHEVVRGHFDAGTPPDSHRYYCLVDATTGRTERNGVAGQLFVRPDGMTGVKGGAVSFYSCADAEQRGILVTAGYVLSAAARSAGTTPAPVPRADIPSPQNTQLATSAPPLNGVSKDSVDVGGVRLGMSPGEVRAVLQAKQLLDYHESARNLNDQPATAMHLPAAGRFLNTISAWTSAPAAGNAGAADSEAYEVMFTPVPGNERAMTIVHTMAYSSETSLREMTLQNGLIKKYGGYAAATLPNSPTWRMQKGGDVLVGDSCKRRAVVGGLREVDSNGRDQQNLALKTTPEEFQYQIDHCGIAIVTEDHIGIGATAQDRAVTRVTVTAYSPLTGLDGATAAMQLMQTAQKAAEKSNARRIKDSAPNL